MFETPGFMDLGSPVMQAQLFQDLVASRQSDLDHGFLFRSTDKLHTVVTPKSGTVGRAMSAYQEQE